MKGKERKRIIIDPITPITEKVSKFVGFVIIGIVVFVTLVLVLLARLISGLAYVIESVFLSIGKILENIGLGFMVTNLKIMLFRVIFPGFEKMPNPDVAFDKKHIVGYFVLAALVPFLSCFIVSRFVGRLIGTWIIALFFNITLFFVFGNQITGINNALLGFGFLVFLALLSGFLAALITRKKVGPEMAYLVLCLIIIAMLGHILDPLGFYGTTAGELFKQTCKEHLTLPLILVFLPISAVLYSIPLVFFPEKEKPS